MTSNRRRTGGGFTLVELLVVIAIVAVLLAILLPAVQQAREAARRSACTNQLKQIITATHNYEGQHEALPPGARLHQNGDEGVSWCVLVLPFMEAQEIYDQVQPDAAGGFGLKQLRVPTDFVCPSAEPAAPEAPGGSHYDGISGSCQAVDGTWELDDFFTGSVCTDGAFVPGDAIRFSEITDGSSNTLALGERSYFVNFDLWVPGSKWVGPTPLDKNKVQEVRMFSTRNFRHVINGSPTVSGYFGLDSSAPPGADKSLKPNDFSFGSVHPGGAMFAYVDGAVRFHTDGMDITLLRDLATRNGGETLER